MRILKIVLTALLLILLFVALGVGALVWTTGRPTAEAQAALVSDGQATAQTGEWLTFRPAGPAPTTGLIFYPGGLVHPESYAPLARAIASQGYLVVIPPMPLNLAVVTPNVAEAVIAAHPEIQKWAIGGHSLGGSMAARYAANHPDRIAGLALWASYPEPGLDLSGLPLAVVSVYGSEDGLASLAEIEQSKAQLPAATRFVRIEGGNHAQFGAYGPQRGDNPAAISAEEQARQTVQATVALLAGLRP